MVELRWFTPLAEVDLCGHATLAAAHVLYQHLAYQKPNIEFHTRSGELFVERVAGGYSIEFPATNPVQALPPEGLLEGIDCTPVAILNGYDHIVVLKDEAKVREFKPDLLAWKDLDLRGVLITARGNEVDFVSRCFFPKLGVNEDPVTGSAHCQLAPYWSNILGKSTLVGKQLSTRTGVVACQMQRGSRCINRHGCRLFTR